MLTAAQFCVITQEQLVVLTTAALKRTLFHIRTEALISHGSTVTGCIFFLAICKMNVK